MIENIAPGPFGRSWEVSCLGTSRESEKIYFLLIGLNPFYKWAPAKELRETYFIWA